MRLRRLTGSGLDSGREEGEFEDGAAEGEVAP